MAKSRIIVPIVLTLLLSACGSGSITFNVAVDTAAGVDRQEMLGASLRMIERRVQAIEQQGGWQNLLEDSDLQADGDDTTITVKLAESEAVDMLIEDMTFPFSFEFMVQVPMEEAEIVVAETQGYRTVNLNASHVRQLEDRLTGDGAEVLVEFTGEGITRKTEVFTEHAGETMGLFVRGQPVYQFVVEAADTNSDSFIIKVPQAELASVFADDVNAGLHVTFTPVQ
jgi:hypothetical protein